MFFLDTIIFCLTGIEKMGISECEYGMYKDPRTNDGNHGKCEMVIINRFHSRLAVFAIIKQ